MVGLVLDRPHRLSRATAAAVPQIQQARAPTNFGIVVMRPVSSSRGSGGPGQTSTGAARYAAVAPAGTTNRNKITGRCGAEPSRRGEDRAVQT